MTSSPTTTEVVASLRGRPPKKHGVQKEETWRKFRVEATIQEMKAKFSRAKYLQEVLGIWTKEGRGWYKHDHILGAQELGQQRKLKPVMSRAEDAQQGGEVYYFLGEDPAPSQTANAADGAIIILRGIPIAPPEQRDNPAAWKLDAVYAKRVRGASMRQWSGLTHELHRRFNFSKICIDPGAGGGGGYLRVELGKSRQLIENVECEVKPILTPDDQTSMNGHFILCMFGKSDFSISQMWPDVTRGDDILRDYAHVAMQSVLEHRQMGWPNPDDKERAAEQERDWCWRILSAIMPEQFESCRVAVQEDGETLRLTHSNSRIYMYQGKSDFACAMLDAYVGFLAWLKGSEEWKSGNEEDEVRFFM